jgi:hypothetical protein
MPSNVARWPAQADAAQLQGPSPLDLAYLVGTQSAGAPGLGCPRLLLHGSAGVE